MNPQYAATFSRHRRLLLLPLLVTMLVAVWYVASAPKAYLSTASLWFDNPPPHPSSVGNTNDITLPPAAQQQQVLTELLTTRSFRIEVGHRGPLASYLEQHSDTGWGPAALLGSLRGSGSLDDRIVADLGPKQIETTVAGPQVLAVSLRGPSAEVAARTLGALVAQFKEETTSTLDSRGEAAVTYFRSQVRAASDALASARSDVASYRAGHPGASSDSDLTLHSLVQAEKAAAVQLVAATNSLNQASLTAAAPAVAKASFRVIDPAKVPTGPVSNHKKELLAIVAGLFVGALLSALAVIAMTRLEPVVAGWRRASEAAPEEPEVSGDVAPEPVVAEVEAEPDPAPKKSASRTTSKTRSAPARAKRSSTPARTPKRKTAAATRKGVPADEKQELEPVPAAEVVAVEEPVVEEPTAEEPTAEEPVAESPAASEPVAESAAPEEPEPVAERPEPVADDLPVSEAPADEPPASTNGHGSPAAAARAAKPRARRTSTRRAKAAQPKQAQPKQVQPEPEPTPVAIELSQPAEPARVSLADLLPLPMESAVAGSGS